MNKTALLKEIRQDIAKISALKKTLHKKIQEIGKELGEGMHIASDGIVVHVKIHEAKYLVDFIEPTPIKD